jgi:hypothetical protein
MNKEKKISNTKEFKKELEKFLKEHLRFSNIMDYDFLSNDFLRDYLRKNEISLSNNEYEKLKADTIKWLKFIFNRDILKNSEIGMYRPIPRLYKRSDFI